MHSCELPARTTHSWLLVSNAIALMTLSVVVQIAALEMLRTLSPTFADCNTAYSFSTSAENGHSGSTNGTSNGASNGSSAKQQYTSTLKDINLEVHARYKLYSKCYVNCTVTSASGVHIQQLVC
jgi:hypothetical protein